MIKIRLVTFRDILQTLLCNGFKPVHWFFQCIVSRETSVSYPAKGVYHIPWKRCAVSRSGVSYPVTGVYRIPCFCVPYPVTWQAVNKPVNNTVATSVQQWWNLHTLSFPLPEIFAKFLLLKCGSNLFNRLLWKFVDSHSISVFEIYLTFISRGDDALSWSLG